MYYDYDNHNDVDTRCIQWYDNHNDLNTTYMPPTSVSDIKIVTIIQIQHVIQQSHWCKYNWAWILRMDISRFEFYIFSYILLLDEIIQLLRHKKIMNTYFRQQTIPTVIVVTHITIEHAMINATHTSVTIQRCNTKLVSKW